MLKRLFASLVTVLACAWAFCAYAASSGQLLNGRQQFVNANGSPLVSGTVMIYQPGTTSPVTSYMDPGLSSANTWPIVLDANGMASIWLPPGNYREIVQDSSGVTLFDQTTSTTGYATSISPGATIGTSGDVLCTATQFTGGSAITLPCTIQPNVVSNSKLAQMNANTIKGNNTGSPANALDLTASQVVSMMAATGSQVAAGASSTTVITPAAFVAAGQFIGTTGCITLPGGLIEQWGYVAGPFSNGATSSITFLASGCPFTSVVYNVQLTADLSGHTPGSAPYAVVTTAAPSTTSVSTAVQGYQSSLSQPIAGYWWSAIGK